MPWAGAPKSSAIRPRNHLLLWGLAWEIGIDVGPALRSWLPLLLLLVSLLLLLLWRLRLMTDPVAAVTAVTPTSATSY